MLNAPLDAAPPAMEPLQKHGLAAAVAHKRRRHVSYKKGYTKKEERHGINISFRRSKGSQFWPKQWRGPLVLYIGHR